MVRLFLSLSLIAASAAAVAQQPTQASVRTTPQVRDIFERDWVLMNWALKFFDSDHDVLISDQEAVAAAERFRSMADKNGDGRITPDEYRAARASILAQY
jgi:hypothetical protein